MRKVLLLALLVPLVHCKKDEPPKEPPFDADARSGPDGKRIGARSIRPNTPVTDEVNFQKQDKTDWYVVQLVGKPGLLTTDISWDNVNSDIIVDIFDDAGTQVAASPVRSTQYEKEKKLLTQIDKPGTYYIRVTAPGKPDGSVYTMQAHWELPVEPKPEPVVEEPKKPKKVVEREREVRPDPMPRERPPSDTLQGRIVSAYNDGSVMMLQIDKGSAMGVKVGMSGSVLSGSSGEEPLDGGEFKITQVIGPNKSLAASAIKSIGHNTRVSITLSR
jgi:hypothetical protein